MRIYDKKHKKRISFFLLTCLISALFTGCGRIDAFSDSGSNTEKEVSTFETTATDETASPEPTTPWQATDSGTDAPSNGSDKDNIKDSFESASKAAGSMKIGWNLGNTLDSTGDWISRDSTSIVTNFETAWGNPVTSKELIKHVKELGFGAVRIPVTWNYHFDAAGNIDKNWLDRVTELVDCVLANDMYCIINIHHDTGDNGWLRASYANFTANHDKYEKLWTQIATQFRDYDDKLLFEGFNEMLDESSNWSKPGSDALNAINMYNQSFVSCVRATGGNNSFRNLLVNTYAASSDEDIISAFKLPYDTAKNHLIVEVHSYEPWSFTSTTATWTVMTSVFGDKEKHEVDLKLEILDKYFVSQNIPLIIGEFGSEDKSNTVEREKWASYVVSEAKKYGITCFVWDNGGKFNMGLVDRYNQNDPFPTIIKAMIDAAN